MFKFFDDIFALDNAREALKAEKETLGLAIKNGWSEQALADVRKDIRDAQRTVDVLEKIVGAKVTYFANFYRRYGA